MSPTETTTRTESDTFGPIEVPGIVRGEDDGTRTAPLADDRRKKIAALRVEAERRLVEQENGGIEEQREGEPEPLLHPARKSADAPSSHAREPDPFEQSVEPGTVCARAPGPAEEGEIFPRAEVFVEGEIGSRPAERPPTIVLPELANSGYVFRDRAEAFALAEEVPTGETTAAWIDAARRHDVYIVAGIAEAEVLGVKRLIALDCFCAVSPQTAECVTVRFVVSLK